MRSGTMIFTQMNRVIFGRPAAEAIVAEADREGLAGTAESFHSHAGGGVEATAEGKQILVGTVTLLADAKIVISDTALAHIARLESEGKTAMLVSIDGFVAGVLAVADTVRPGAGAAVDRLRKMGMSVALLTGDAQRVAEAVARTVGIEEVQAGVKPGEKAAAIQAWQEGGAVAMVGDGVNDAPALASADLGVAMGRASDVAMEAADVTLLRADLSGVADAILLSRRTLKIIHQNLFWAFLFNVIGIPLAAFGLLNPMLAALAMAFSSVSVVTNSLRLKSAKLG